MDGSHGVHRGDDDQYEVLSAVRCSGGELMSYNRISGRRIWHPSRGFRLKPRRLSFSVHWLRLRFFYFIRFCLSKWKFPYERMIKFLKKKQGKKSKIKSHNLILNGYGCRGDTRSYEPLNPFYSEAISDCLEFIKLSSVSAAEDGNQLNS
ncbi:hypothetical protein TorRG33x02_249730 [Trema orientale]|uniref:Uncharacterized protein n=1 Tax=Trema orientale TaxID=63057 RepID=A0A2P5DIV6_TREOI|nr:hypothetical protein TorRG33x02_249730 [Trema orientale]